MVTCHVRYEIDPAKIEAFERFAARWMELVNQRGGVHHGYFLPAEGASDIATPCLASRAWQSTSATGRDSALIRSSSRPTASAMNLVA
jgi:hypothetical protein